MMKRILSLLMAFAMLFSLTAQGFAESGEVGTPDNEEQLANVTFDANGGHFENGDLTAVVSYPVGESPAEDFPTPVREDEHYEFTGWYYDEDCVSGPISYLNYYPEDGQVFYAGWDYYCVIVLDANGGYFSDPSVTELSFNVPRGAYFNGSFPDPTHQNEHTHFKNDWYLEPDCSGEPFELYDTEFESDIRLYAGWQTRYTIRFMANGGFFKEYRYDENGDWVAFEVDSIDIEFVEGAVIGGSFNVENKDSSKGFNAWYYDEACTEPAFDLYSDYTVTKDETFYAGWNDCYSISFDANGGYFGNEDVTVYTVYVNPGDQIDQEPLPVYPNERMRFAGWYSNAACTGDRIYPYLLVPESDMIFYAKWAVNNPFVDVPEGKYYHDAVLWAYNHDPQITGGTDATHFSPNNTCTREQIATFLWKACGAPEPTNTNNPFKDVKAGKYYYKAVLWAVERGITGGVSADRFGVGQPCRREQAMTFLWKAVGSPMPESGYNPFTDVEPGKYYYYAVLSAVQNGITGGVSADKFGVGQPCTRGQIVTFLYKLLGRMG